MMNRENYAVSLFQFDDFRAGLHTRSLFRQNELATREIDARDREQKGDL
jgi:membrane-anchored protein YejM (alkaline phosphatase superfamily)